MEPDVAADQRSGTRRPDSDAAALSRDAPILDGTQDFFGRADYARRVARLLVSSARRGSTVVGIMGPWGSGKSSALNLVELCLRTGHGATCIRFNPWYFETVPQLIMGFFAELAKSLGVSTAVEESPLRRFRIPQFRLVYLRP